MQIGAEYCHVYDLETAYRPYLENLLKTRDIHLGSNEGNILQVPLGKLLGSAVDVLLAGPPCPPWAGNGNHNGQRDDRARVFDTVLKWVVLFIKCCGLLFAVLENVQGFSYEFNGKESAQDKYLRILRKHAPEFCWDVCVLHLKDYLLPQSRVR
eukprot:8701852-Karenia_brevis.AAC.1